MADEGLLPFAEGTWRSWLADDSPPPTRDALLTRPQFLAALARAGVSIDARTLSHWERTGALPKPVRRWHQGATRAMYLPELVSLAATIPTLRSGGRSLTEIGVILRDRLLQQDANGEPTLQELAEPLADEAAPKRELADADLTLMLARFARHYQKRSGFRVAQIELIVADESGHRRRHRLRTD